MNKLRRIYTVATASLLTLSTLFCLTACYGEAEDETRVETTESETAQVQTETEINYDGVDIKSHVKSVTYVGHEITLADKEASSEDALWEAILASAEITSYPEDKVEYFFRQTKQAYMYLVNGNEEDYKLLLKNRGTDEVKLREEARRLVKKDLVYYYIVEKENIALTGAEKTQLFEKYVEKYVVAYGYNREYFVENMTEIIYDSMLYDKTMEFLLKNNTVKIEQGTEKEEPQK